MRSTSNDKPRECCMVSTMEEEKQVAGRGSLDEGCAVRGQGKIGLELGRDQIGEPHWSLDLVLRAVGNPVTNQA